MAGRGSKSPSIRPGDFVLVIDERESPLVISDWNRAPYAGETLRIPRTIAERETLDSSVRYLVHQVEHGPPPGETRTIFDFTLPWCFAQRCDERASKVGGARPSPRSAPPTLDSHDGQLDEYTASAAQQESRELANQLDELADDLALRINRDQLEGLRPFVEQLNAGSRRAKHLGILVQSAALRNGRGQ